MSLSFSFQLFIMALTVGCAAKLNFLMCSIFQQVSSYVMGEAMGIIVLNTTLIIISRYFQYLDNHYSKYVVSIKQKLEISLKCII